tara:strand:+ start:1360 stop:2004 length:645 start_codon:yes stop_codon:yes gene_type:complete
MAARQQHGFEYEKHYSNKSGILLWEEYAKKYPTQSTDQLYTSVWDGIDERQPGIHYNGKPVQIKCIGIGNAVDLGDIFRNSDKSENFDLVVSFRDSTLGGLGIVEEYVIPVDCNKWNDLLKYDKYDEWKNFITNEVSNDYSYDQTWKIEKNKRMDDWGRDRLIQPRFKRDHKNQRRIQCSIPNKIFYNYFIVSNVVTEEGKSILTYKKEVHEFF